MYNIKMLLESLEEGFLKLQLLRNEHEDVQSLALFFENKKAAYEDFKTLVKDIPEDTLMSEVMKTVIAADKALDDETAEVKKPHLYYHMFPMMGSKYFKLNEELEILVLGKKVETEKPITLNPEPSTTKSSVKAEIEDLGDLRRSIKKGLKSLREFAEANPESKDVQEFFQTKKSDYFKFLNLTNSLTADNTIGEVICYLRGEGAASKFYGGICHKGEEYFKITKKLRHKLESQQISFFDN